MVSFGTKQMVILRHLRMMLHPFKSLPCWSVCMPLDRKKPMGTDLLNRLLKLRVYPRRFGEKVCQLMPKLMTEARGQPDASNWTHVLDHKF